MKVKRLDAALLIESLGQVKPRVSKGYGVTTPLMGKSRRQSLGLNGYDPDEEEPVSDVEEDLMKRVIRRLGGSLH